MTTATNAQEQMNQVHVRRRVNLRILRDECGGTTAMAKKLGHTNTSYLAQLAGQHPTRKISETVARKIEAILGIQSGWLDELHDRRCAPPPGVVAPVAPPSTAPAHQPPIGSVDSRLLARCIELVWRECSTRGVVLPASTLADVVSVAYLTGGIESNVSAVVGLLTAR